MDLHAIASGAIQAVNIDRPAIWRRSTGYTTTDDGLQVPAYEEVEVMANVQPVADSLVQSYGLNMDAPMRSIYVRGDIRGIVRKDGKGGDLVLTDEGLWKVVTVSETWPTWCHAIVVLQDSGETMGMREELDKANQEIDKLNVEIEALNSKLAGIASRVDQLNTEHRQVTEGGNTGQILTASGGGAYGWSDVPALPMDFAKISTLNMTDVSNDTSGEFFYLKNYKTFISDPTTEDGYLTGCFYGKISASVKCVVTASIFFGGDFPFRQGCFYTNSTDVYWLCFPTVFCPKGVRMSINFGRLNNTSAAPSVSSVDGAIYRVYFNPVYMAGTGRVLGAKRNASNAAARVERELPGMPE